MGVKRSTPQGGVIIERVGGAWKVIGGGVAWTRAESEGQTERERENEYVPPTKNVATFVGHWNHSTQIKRNE